MIGKKTYKFVQNDITSTVVIVTQNLKTTRHSQYFNSQFLSRDHLEILREDNGRNDPAVMDEESTKIPYFIITPSEMS